MQLTQPRFEWARPCRQTPARSLEAARFRDHFEARPPPYWRRWRRFKIRMGLGHRLEPDVRSPDNSVTCPTIAFQLMRSSSTPGCGKPGYGTDSTTTIRKRWVGALFPDGGSESPCALVGCQRWRIWAQSTAEILG